MTIGYPRQPNDDEQRHAREQELNDAAREHEDEAARTHERQGSVARSPVVGYLIVLVGVAGWVVSSFLPLYRITGTPAPRITLYGQITAFDSIATELGGLIYLFGAIAAIGAISVLGVRSARRWIAVLLAGAAVAWFLTTTGVLLSLAGSLPDISVDGVSLTVGYWGCWVSVAAVVAGTAMVVMAARREVASGAALTPDE